MTNMIQMVEKLPTYLHSRWKGRLQEIEREGPARFEDMIAFVEEAAEEANHPVFRQIGANKITHGATFVSNITQSNRIERPNKPCKACQGDHFILKCQTFKDMTISERLTLVREKRICMNCLKPGHKNTECWADRRFPIETCEERHNVYFHVDKEKRRIRGHTNCSM